MLLTWAIKTKAKLTHDGKKTHFQEGSRYSSTSFVARSYVRVTFRKEENHVEMKRAGKVTVLKVSSNTARNCAWIYFLLKLRGHEKR